MLAPIPATPDDASRSSALPPAQASGFVPPEGQVNMSEYWQYLLPTSPTSVSSLQDAQGSITWTADAIRALWKFILQIRDARRVGLVAVAYVPFSPSSAHDKGKGKAKEKGRHRAKGKEKTVEEKDPLGVVDHIKVYLDARYAMHVRELFHLWRYEYHLPPEVVEVRRQREREKEEKAKEIARASRQDDQGEDADVAMDVDGDDAGQAQKRAQRDAEAQDGKKKATGKEREDIASFRMFRGAKLVLLNHENEALLTC